MNILQVRKGQFVYYKNELHKVYSIRPLSRIPILMYRIKDMEQVSCRAEEITYYKPKHMDSFMLQGVRYTLRNDVQAVEEGYILISNPNPGQMDSYTLNEFEKVEKLIDGNVFTTLQNTVKWKEFLVMAPGVKSGSNPIDYADMSLVTESQKNYDTQLEQKALDIVAVTPTVGDIYLNLDNGIKAMVVAVIEDEVVLGHGERIKSSELVDSDSWNVIYLTEDLTF